MFKKIFLSFFICIIFNFNYLFSEDSLLSNSGFEDGAGTAPDFWSFDNWLKDISITENEWLTGVSHSGNRCVLIKNHQLNDARIIQGVTIQKEKLYKFSCWVKTENIGSQGLGANLSIVSLQEYSVGIHGTNDWQEVIIYIKGASSDSAVQLTLGVGGYSAVSSGLAWFDDAMLAVVDNAPVNAKIITLKDKAGGLTQAEKNKYRLKIETRGSYWIITILMAAAAVVVLVLIIKRIKGEEQNVSTDQNNEDQAIKIEKENTDEKENIDDEKENID